jgi:hypothetical protein
MIEVHRPLSLVIVGDLMLRSAPMMMTRDAIILESVHVEREEYYAWNLTYAIILARLIPT